MCHPWKCWHISDGNSNPAWTGGSCMHTDGTQPGGWWAVDLKEKYTIQKVKITNIGDSSGMNKAHLFHLRTIAKCWWPWTVSNVKVLGLLVCKRTLLWSVAFIFILDNSTKPCFLGVFFKTSRCWDIRRFLHQNRRQFQPICFWPNYISSLSLSANSSWYWRNQNIRLSQWCCWKICFNQFPHDKDRTIAHLWGGGQR